MTAVLDIAARPPVSVSGSVALDVAAAGAIREARVDRRSLAPLADARAFVTACGFDWRLAEVDRDTLVLVVDELVSNALTHVAWPQSRHVALVRLTLTGRQVGVEVRDPDPRLPRWPGSQVWDLSVIDGPAGPDDEHLVRDHGLGIVSALVDDLCALPEPGGKIVRAIVPVGGAR